MEELNEKVKGLNEESEVIDVIIENEEEIIANSMYEKGISQGKKENQIETARNMPKENMDISLISKITGLSQKEIEKL